MITNLKLTNWRSHLDTNLKFSEGTNCFIGKMGAGKTSVLDAMCFALFGTFPTLQSKKIKLADVIMKKPKVKDEASVELTFNIDGSEWTVKRVISSGRSTAELRKNGALIEAPQSTKVTEEIEKILKVNYDLFTRAIYSEQNQIDMFLTIPKGQRMKKIDQLLAIDKFENARLTTKALINKCNLSVVDKQQVIEDLKKDENIRNIENLKREIIKLDQENVMIERLLREENDKKNNFERILKDLKEQEKRLKSIEDKINLDSALINSAKIDIERLKEDLMNVAELTIAELREKFNSLEKEYTEMIFNLESEQKSFDRLDKVMIQKETKALSIEKEKIPDIEKKIDDKKHLKSLLRKDKISSLEKELKSKTSEFSSIQKEFQMNNAKIEDIRISINELKSVGASCPICDNNLTDAKKKSIIEKKNKSIDKMDIINKKHQISMDKLESRIKALTEDINSVSHIKAKLEMYDNVENEEQFLKDALKQLKEDLKLHASERSMLEKTISVAKKRSEELRAEKDRLKSFFDKRMMVEEKIMMVRDLEKQIDNFKREKLTFSPISISRIDSLDIELKVSIARQSELKTNLENIALLVAEKRKRLEDIENKLKILDNYSADIRKIDAISDQMKLLETSLISTQEQLRKNFVSTVNQAMQTLWSDIYPYEDIYDVRLAIESGDYVLQLQDSSGWMNADGSASGGERSIACLALRIAFALVLAPQLRWLVLDEPTANLDSKAVEDLATVLRDKVGEFVDQIFLITHDTALETAVSGYLYKIDREKEKDGYTRIAQIISPEN